MKKGKAVAIVECNGLPTAIAFLDTALKSANVELLGLELAKGEGMVDVKLAGNIGAVKAATKAGIAVANMINGILGQKIIARPHESIECMMSNDYIIKNLGTQKNVSDDQSKLVKENEIIANEKHEDEPRLKKEDLDCQEESLDADESLNETVLDNQNTRTEGKKNYTCNLCKDVACPRVKGRPHTECLYYNEDDQ